VLHGPRFQVAVDGPTHPQNSAPFVVTSGTDPRGREVHRSEVRL
jgi:hypothetical protein